MRLLALKDWVENLWFKFFSKKNPTAKLWKAFAKSLKEKSKAIKAAHTWNVHRSQKDLARQKTCRKTEVEGAAAGDRSATWRSGCLRAADVSTKPPCRHLSRSWSKTWNYPVELCFVTIVRGRPRTFMNYVSDDGSVIEKMYSWNVADVLLICENHFRF